jgi:hypothetical protein
MEKKIGFVLISVIVLTLSAIIFEVYFPMQISFAQLGEAATETLCDPNNQTCPEAATETLCDPNNQTCTAAELQQQCNPTTQTCPEAKLQQQCNPTIQTCPEAPNTEGSVGGMSS